MSWLGVNLNDSLTSLKGQISNLTKEVLTEDYKIEGEETEVISRERAKELETSVLLHKHEVDDLRKSRAELEERLRATDLHAVQQTATLKQQIEELQSELESIKQKHTEWGWDSSHDESRAKEPNTSSSEEKSSDSAWQERALRLEKEIHQLRDHHQHEISVLQDHHGELLKRGQDNLLQGQACASPETTSNLPTGRSCDDCGKLRLQLDQTTSLNEELLPKVENFEKENQNLKDENQILTSNLEELDQQHQIVIEQILVKKKALEEQLSLANDRNSIHEEKNEEFKNDPNKISNELPIVSDQNNITSKLDDEIKSLKSENEKLTKDHENDFTRAVETKDIIAKQLQEITNLKCKCEELNILKLQLSNDLQSISASNEVTLGENKTLNSDIIDVRTTLQSIGNKLGIELVDGDNKIGKYDGVIDDMTNKLSKMQLQQSEVASMDCRVSDLQNKLDEKELQCQHMIAACEVKEIENEKREKDINRLNNELKTNEVKFNNVIIDKTSVYDKLMNEMKFKNDKIQMQINMKDQQEMFNLNQIKELELHTQIFQSKVQQLEGVKNAQLEEVRKLASSHDVIAPEDVIEVVRDTVQERDDLQTRLNNALQEVKDAQDLLETVEVEKLEIERECEDLRDQLEELQCGERQQPEGSVTVRGLPTIQEEENEPTVPQDSGEVVAKTDQTLPEADHCKDTREGACVGQVSDDNVQLMTARIKQLRAESQALSEVRRNLEVELASCKEARDIATQQALEASVKLGNLSNLEIEASSLRAANLVYSQQINDFEKLKEENTVMKTENETQKKEIEQLNVVAAQAQVFMIEKRLFEEKAAEAEQVCAEKEEQIKYLELKIDTIQSHNITTSISDNVDDQCAELQKNIDKLRAQLIYKDDMIDSHTHGLEQIAGIFSIKDHSLRNIYVNIKNEHTTLINKIGEMKNDLEKIIESNTELQEEMNDISEKSMENLSDTTNSTIDELNTKLEVLNAEKQELLDYFEVNIQKMAILEKTNQQLTLSLSTEQDSVTDLQNKLSVTQNHCKEQQEFIEISSDNKNEELSKLLEDKNNIIDKSISKNNELQENINKLTQDKSELETTLYSNEKNLTDNKNHLEEFELVHNQMIRAHHTKIKIEIEENELLTQQLTSMTTERTQMIETLNQKHQENVSYHSELQKLSQLVTQERHKSQTDHSDLTKLMEEKELVNISTKEELNSLKDEVEKMQKNNSQTNNLQIQIDDLKKDRDQQKSRSCNAEQERDQLRVANSSFNTQYQEQSKELTSMKDKECRLSVECDRLRGHLVTIEETYTGEALRAEEREATIRATLSKLEDRYNNHSNLYSSASQRANVQVEALQEQLQQMASQRDHAVLRLHTAEETSDQHLQSLNTLQQVLQDFRKGQDRDIAEVTHRDRVKLTEQVENNRQLHAEVDLLKDKLTGKDSELNAANILHDQIVAKQRAIVSLKAQVATQEQSMKKTKDEVSLLRSSTECKVDKHLIRNLLVGYFATPSDKRLEVLHVIATVLDLSSEERTRTGLDTQGNSWLSSIANFLAPPATNVLVASKVDVLDHSSLSQAFVRFLEDESSPRPTARLPAIEMAEETQEKAEKKAKARANSVGKISPLTIEGSRSPNSSPLLAGASITPLLPTFAPVTSSANFGASPLLPYAPILDPGIQLPTVESIINTNTLLSNLLIGDNVKTDDNGNK